MRAWRKEGERLAVCRSSEWNTCDHAVAEWVGKQGWKPKMEHINHLVVSLPSVAAIKAIASIRHRLDHRTTICLLQDGLGLIEAINTWCFPDPRTRPTYILGHMTHSLGYHTGYHHAALLLKPRKLYLHAVGRNSNWPSRVKYHPPIERQKRATDFLRIMTTAPGLNAEGSTLQNFLLKKLPTIVAKSAVDPVTVVLECSFAEVLESPYGMRLVNQLLDEIYSVIMSLPELPNASKLVKNISRKKLWGDVQGRLRAKGNSQGYMLNSIRKGEMVDIPFLNGWFVKKGEETGIKCPANRMVIDMVKAKRRKYAADQQAGDVQFEEL
ncbi:hypothetical protein NKR23_g1837 [Pleurostoma richardsiae]|uniref:Ketopantoate reductase C-terminal domain-containing protein n=1 Tax=Pleurostoma richardsiae TaxID=41990 RepID=A0AA38VP23_9PEZI|nr:hypothetical protein NKR23_g1837 [Pleurostoma richardsiae]